MDDFNDQYCRLAREGRLDGSDSLKLKFIGINGDWDELSDEVPFHTTLIKTIVLERLTILYLKRVVMFCKNSVTFSYKSCFR